MRLSLSFPEISLGRRFQTLHQGLCELEASLGGALTDTKVRAPKSKRGPDKDGYVRRKERLEWDLKETYDDIKASQKERGEKSDPFTHALKSKRDRCPFYFTPILLKWSGLSLLFVFL